MCACASYPPALQGYLSELQQMYKEWPFFQSTLDLVEMVLAKADMRIASLYDELLVTEPGQIRLGKALREKFLDTVDGVLKVRQETSLSLPQ